MEGAAANLRRDTRRRRQRRREGAGGHRGWANWAPSKPGLQQISPPASCGLQIIQVRDETPPEISTDRRAATGSALATHPPNLGIPRDTTASSSALVVVREALDLEYHQSRRPLPNAPDDRFQLAGASDGITPVQSVDRQSVNSDAGPEGRSYSVRPEVSVEIAS